MRHYVMLHDGQEILGVWEAQNELQVAKVRVNLGLQFPNCQMEVRPATDYEAFKSLLGMDLDGFNPEPPPSA